MSDEIKPVMTPEEWAALGPDMQIDSRYANASTSLSIDHKGRIFVHSDLAGKEQVIVFNESDSDVPAKLIALLNHSLPDDSPYKITRADIAAILELVITVSDFAIVAPTIAKLAALLPPQADTMTP